MIQSRWSQNVLLGLTIFVLVILGLWGWRNAVAAAKSKRIVKDAHAIVTAFGEFKKDQNRYPATTEFNDNDVMRQYIANFPPQNFPTALCQKNYDYFNANPQTYELRFCLPKAVNGYNAGWNTLKP